MAKGFMKIEKDKPAMRQSHIPKIMGCEACGLYKACKTPKISYKGEGGKAILILMGAPSRYDDRRGIYSDERFRFLEQTLKLNGIDLWKDCWVSYTVQCLPERGKAGKDAEITPINKAACSRRVQPMVRELAPKKIFVMSSTAMEVLYYGKASGRFNMSNYNGRLYDWAIPDQDYKAMVYTFVGIDQILEPLYKRRSFLEKIDKWAGYDGDIWEDPQLYDTDGFELRIGFFERQLEKALVPKDIYIHNYASEQIVLEDVHDAINVIRGLLKTNVIAFDTETTGLKPQADGHEIVCWGFSDGFMSWGFPNFKDSRFQKLLKRLLSDPKIRKYGANIKFEHNWIKTLYGYDVQGWLYDTVIGTHVLDHRKGIASLKFQTFVELGILGYDEELDPYLKSSGKSTNALNQVKKAPMDKLCEYCAMDAHFTYKIADKQYNKIQDDPILKVGYNLFHDGTLSIAEMERRGMLLDQERLIENDLEMEKDLLRLEEEIQQIPEVVQWNKEKRAPFNFNSTAQQSEMFFGRLGYTPVSFTDTGAPKVDSETLEEIDHPLAQKILLYKTRYKIRNTFLAGLKREAVDSVVHPEFLLHSVQSYRSSSVNPNFQNLSKRDEFSKTMIKTCIKPRPGFLFVEYDYSSLEAYMGCNYHKDSQMAEYLLNPETDMHRDAASSIFMTPPEKVTRNQRQVGKTFNFAAQYLTLIHI